MRHTWCHSSMSQIFPLTIRSDTQAVLASHCITVHDTVVHSPLLKTAAPFVKARRKTRFKTFFTTPTEIKFFIHRTFRLPHLQPPLSLEHLSSPEIKFKISASHTFLASGITCFREHYIQVFLLSECRFTILTRTWNPLLNGAWHSFISNLSHDRSTASSKTIPPLNAI
jgi:hypothetical protein